MTHKDHSLAKQFQKLTASSTLFENRSFSLPKLRLYPNLKFESFVHKGLADAIYRTVMARYLDQCAVMPKTPFPSASLCRWMEIGEDEMALMLHNSGEFSGKVMEVRQVAQSERTNREIRAAASNRRRHAVRLNEPAAKEGFATPLS
jgi:hypothetical protein